MSHKGMLYNVVVFKGNAEGRTESVVYTTTKKEKAEQFLRDYLKRCEDNVDGAYIESKCLNSFNKRNYVEDLEY